MEGYHQLGHEERIRIEILREEGHSLREIAQRLQRQPSTVSRELRRNSNADGSYRAPAAGQRARRRCRGRPSRLIVAPCHAQPAGSPAWQYFNEKLKAGWSPEAIAARFRMQHPLETLCHETIYRFIYAQENRSQQWWKYLERQRPRRRPRSKRSQQRAQAGSRPSLSERPESANQRTEVGHWEADLLCFRRPGQVVLHVVERQTRFGAALKLASKHAAALMQRLIQLFTSLPSILRESVTFDNGSEFFEYQRLEEELGIASYFCDPYASWQKGTVENRNRALRRYLPRWTDLDGLDEEELIDIREELNDRPMKCLGWLTPREMLCSLTGLNVALHV